MSTDNSSSSNRYWLCPLYSFDCDCDSIDLANGIQIKSISVLPGLSSYIQERSRNLYGQWDDPSKYNGVVLLPYRATAIKVTTENDITQNIKIGLEENDRARDLLVDLVTALRLCHEGQITAGPLISSSVNRDSQWSFGGNVVWTFVSQRDFLHRDPKYVSHQSDVPHVNKLVINLTKLRKLKKLDAINIALRRFNSAYHGYPEDRLVDQMIAFESLYIGDDKELGYKLALRTAFLLTGKEDERCTIFNDMKKAYTYRSNIVHGSHPSREQLKAISPKIEEYLRQSIRTFLRILSQGDTLKELKTGPKDKIAKLDENILNNGKLLA